ncbi:hypothetical protein Glove_346g150 [Diversispora epigaea]|uniref:Protein kinase domain-containing protein n=1 Tax=Diversispora epigaea TaxID=1348612 RepID=A0A397HFR1_9GLOM|nr:hypothetical protein Glove_346g150 [Diversispora epigaea]
MHKITEIFFARSLEEYIRCKKCNRKSINISHYYYGMSFLPNSGNKNIDDFIKGTRSQNNEINDPHLIWVPFEEFKGVEKIGQGGFSQIFKATWKINEGIDGKGTARRSSERVFVLKVLNNSQNVDTEFLNELKYTFQFMSNLNNYEGSIIKCYGVTQEPQTKNYAF